MKARNRPARGRGATGNPEGRFETRSREAFVDDGSEPIAEPRQVPTVVVEQQARSIIARNESPDVPFVTNLPAGSSRARRRRPGVSRRSAGWWQRLSRLAYSSRRSSLS